MTESFDLRAAVAYLLDTTDLTDPGEIAAKLLADMDLNQRAQAFEQVAEMAVSVYLTRDRMSSATAAPAPGGRPSRSKARMVADWWKTELRKRYRGAEGWLMLGEFSADDHVFAAAERHQRAAAISANAGWHERCAEAMRAAGVDRFDDLPADVLADLIASRRPE